MSPEETRILQDLRETVVRIGTLQQERNTKDILWREELHGTLQTLAAKMDKLDSTQQAIQKELDGWKLKAGFLSLISGALVTGAVALVQILRGKSLP